MKFMKNVRKKFLRSILGLLLITNVYGYADELDELEAAQPLENHSQYNDVEYSDNGVDVQYRGYVVLEGIQTRKTHQGSLSANQGPNWEYALTASAQPQSSLELFFDGTGYYIEDSKPQPEGFLNLVGARYRPIDTWLLVAGKERNRRSPGLIYSPSDFLHQSTAMPGLREDRQGVWLTRASYQLPSWTLDFISLPVDQEKTNGLPEAHSGNFGQLMRTYGRIGTWEASFSYGRLEKKQNAGFFIQTFFADVWKFYGEYGVQEKKKLFLWERERNRSWLIGSSYEGATDFRVQAEYLALPDMLNGGEVKKLSDFLMTPTIGGGSTELDANQMGAQGLLLRRQYGLLSFSVIEFEDRLNFFSTYVKSLEDNSGLSLSRLECILGSAWTAGVTYAGILEGANDLSVLHPFDERVSFDLKWSY